MPLDINLFREEKGGDVALLRKSEAARNGKPGIIDEVIRVDKEWRETQFKLDETRRSLNAKQAAITEKYKKKQNADAEKAELQQIKDSIPVIEEKVLALQKSLDLAMRQVGNIVHPSVPVSHTEDENLVVATHGDTPRGAKYHHHQLLHMIDGYSPDKGVTVAGHRGYFLKGVGVLLNQALINFGISFLTKHQYTPLQPPYFMKKDVMAATAQLEQFDEELYKVTGGAEDMYLIATSEQPISAYHKDETLTADQLPLRYAGISTCFRKEAGAHGKDTWGIFRIHQFEKVEQFVITSPEKSWEMHDEMIKLAAEFYKELGFSYRIVAIASGALNNAAAKKLDLEAWFPTLGVYRELVSASNCTDYQARAMETRFGFPGIGDREKKYVHMLNATLTATERTICCILENYQTETGVIVPTCLRPFMGGLEFMPFVKPCPLNEDEKEAAKKKDGKQEKKKDGAAAADKPAADKKPAAAAAEKTEKPKADKKQQKK